MTQGASLDTGDENSMELSALNTMEGFPMIDLKEVRFVTEFQRRIKKRSSFNVAETWFDGARDSL